MTEAPLNDGAWGMETLASMMRDGVTYSDLLNALRVDLQLDATTDILTGSIAAALGMLNGTTNAATPAAAAGASFAFTVTPKWGVKPTRVFAQIGPGGGLVTSIRVEGETNNYTANSFDMQCVNDSGGALGVSNININWIAFFN